MFHQLSSHDFNECFQAKEKGTKVIDEEGLLALIEATSHLAREPMEESQPAASAPAAAAPSAAASSAEPQPARPSGAVPSQPAAPLRGGPNGQCAALQSSEGPSNAFSHA